MDDENNRSRISDWEPGTLDKTRKNIGEIDADEAALMVKKLGGEVMYERSAGSSGQGKARNTGRIIRSQQTASPEPHQQSPAAPKKHGREMLPPISKKAAAQIDRLMMSSEYHIKPNYGLFNFIRSFQKNGTERIIPDFVTYTLKNHVDHIEAFMTAVKTMIQAAPATYKTRIAGGTEAKFKFLRMVGSWTVQGIKSEFLVLQSIPEPLVTADLIPFVRAIYTPLMTVYYYGNSKIPKLIKEIYSDEANYPDTQSGHLSELAKQAITEWLYINDEIIRKLYPLLMRMCSDSYETYPAFFTVKIAEILKFTRLHKFDLLLPEKPQEAPKEEKRKETVAPPQKGLKDSTVTAGLKLLNQLFPQAGFDRLETHPDLYPYFQPLYKFEDGFNLLSPDNPVQTVTVLMRIVEDCIQGCRNIKFNTPEDSRPGADTISAALDEWSAFREETFDRLYCEPLRDLVNSVYSQPGFENSHIGKKTITSLLWQTTYHFLPNFKFEQLLLEHPADESRYRPLFHRTDFVRKYLTDVVNECDAAAKNRSEVPLVQNPWEHYKFDIQNEVSKRLDVLLGAQNTGANTTATNANLIKYTLCFVAVLDWFINNPESPAYTSDPMHIYRISEADGKPQFSAELRNDQNKLFIDSVKANYQKQAK